MARRLRRRYGRMFGRRAPESGPPARTYRIYRHGEYVRTTRAAASGHNKSMREDAVRRSLVHEYGSVAGIDVEEAE